MRLASSPVVTSVVGLLVTACSSPGQPTSGVLLPSAGSGYHLNRASGPLTKQSLAAATALPHDTMARYVDSVTFRRASERVWTSHDDGFVTDIVIELGDDRSATRLVDVASATLPGPATQAFALGVADGRGFVQTSAVHGQTMFCVIAFLAVSTRAFVVTRCTPYPQDTTTVIRLVRDQYARAQS